MARVVWKYMIPLNPFSTRFAVEMPYGSEIVHIGKPAHEGPQMWVLADDAAPSGDRMFEIVGTGQPVPPRSKHVGTWLDSPFVWHLFEMVAPPASVEGFTKKETGSPFVHLFEKEELTVDAADSEARTSDHIPGRGGW